VSDDADALFAAGVAALKDGRATEAVTSFEALADRGVLDAAMSYDRGLAYASRVRVGAEVPGDLGRAAQGFEEARAMSRDEALALDAAQALSVVRAEVGRRRARAGDPVELDQGLGLGRSVTHVVSEDAWCALAAVASVALGAALFVRWLAKSRRARVVATIAAAIAVPLMLIFAALGASLRHERVHRREAVIVAVDARPADDRGITIPNATPLPEAALVEILGARSGWTRVRWGSTEAWVPSSTLRAVARVE
jgi:hypothetical protein